MGRGVPIFMGSPKFYGTGLNRPLVFVRLCVSSEISGTGRRSATLLSPTWRASPGELHRLLRELMRRVVRVKKPLELFRSKRVKPRPSHYKGATCRTWWGGRQWSWLLRDGRRLASHNPFHEPHSPFPERHCFYPALAASFPHREDILLPCCVPVGGEKAQPFSGRWPIF